MCYQAVLCENKAYTPKKSQRNKTEALMNLGTNVAKVPYCSISQKHGPINSLLFKPVYSGFSDASN